VREVMRTYDNSPALHRSSYVGEGDPIEEWRECCSVLEVSIDALVTDAINRGVSLVLEGVHVVPSAALIDRWRASGGTAIGCLLTITDADSHRALIYRRGEVTRKGAAKKLSDFTRIRTIQDEMIRLATENKWLLVEQKLEPDPIEIVTSLLEEG
jgi:2-phosphoglycerate kinase